jgi:peptide/nickel transport system permease protein
VPVLFLVSIGVFMLVALVPGDAAVTLAGGRSATPAAIAHVRQELHLNDPLIVQYGRWLWGVLHLNLGASLVTGVPVTHELASRLPVTLSLVVASAIVALVIGVPLGILAGMRPGSLRDSSARVISSLGIAIPNFWLAVILVSLFAVKWRLVPPTGFVPIQQSFTGWLRDVTLPAITLGFVISADVARQLRGALVEVMDTNYIRTVWAKGGNSRMVMRHGLRNAAIPAVTVFGVDIGYLLGGTLIIEQIFAIPGLGTYMFSGITSHDLPVVQGVALVFVIFAMAMSLLVDITYGYLNPKVRVA